MIHIRVLSSLNPEGIQEGNSVEFFRPNTLMTNLSRENSTNARDHEKTRGSGLGARENSRIWFANTRKLEDRVRAYEKTRGSGSRARENSRIGFANTRKLEELVREHEKTRGSNLGALENRENSICNRAPSMGTLEFPVLEGLQIL